MKRQNLDAQAAFELKRQSYQLFLNVTFAFKKTEKHERLKRKIYDRYQRRSNLYFDAIMADFGDAFSLVGREIALFVTDLVREME